MIITTTKTARLFKNQIGNPSKSLDEITKLAEEKKIIGGHPAIQP